VERRAHLHKNGSDDPVVVCVFNSVCGFSQQSLSSLLIRDLVADLLNYQPDALDLLARRLMPLAMAVVEHWLDLRFRASCFDSVNEGFQVAATEQYEVRLQDPEQRVRVLPETLSQHTGWILVIPLRAPCHICQCNVWQGKSKSAQIERLELSPMWDLLPLVLKDFRNRAQSASVCED
jgi:hypothetical protein